MTMQLPDYGLPSSLGSHDREPQQPYAGIECNPPSSGINSYLSSGVTINRVPRSQIWPSSRHTVQFQP